MKSDKNKSLLEKTNEFSNMWMESVESRIQAAKVYANTVNTLGTEAKHAFQLLPRFKNWTQRQWRFVYLVGSGVIDPVWLDFKTIAVPLALADRKVNLSAQRSINRTGVEIYNVQGELYIVQPMKLEVRHIIQAYNEDGTPRSMKDQLKWLKSKEVENLEWVSKGTLRVRHGCYIEKAELLKLICDPMSNISVADIIEYRRNNRSK